MEPFAIHAAYRQVELLELAAGRRLLAGRPAAPRARTLRVALGCRLVLIGIALLDRTRHPATAPR